MDRCAVWQRVTLLLRSNGIIVTNPIQGTCLSTVLLVSNTPTNLERHTQWAPKVAFKT